MSTQPANQRPWSVIDDETLSALRAVAEHAKTLYDLSKENEDGDLDGVDVRQILGPDVVRLRTIAK